LLDVRALTKTYGRVRGVRGVSFQLNAGEVTGYLGPNGAGKSTTVKILTGLIPPSSGQVLVDGRDIRHDLIGYKRAVGYVPEEPHLYPYMTGREYLELVGRLRALPEQRLRERIDELMRALGLGAAQHSALETYSKGMRQKVLLAAALIHNPSILILDEPLSGLDVTSALIVRGVIERLARAGRTILFSSHTLEVVEKVCARVIILHRGAVVADDAVGRLRDLMNLPSLEEVFTQLVIEEDTERIAGEIVDVIGA
jgi:ABC-2 type transport system ATP-binding protein